MYVYIYICIYIYIYIYNVTSPDINSQFGNTLVKRGMETDKLADLYSGIEIIKNGCAYDKRYHAKKTWFHRPSRGLVSYDVTHGRRMDND